MYKIKTYNKISKIGLEAFDDKYTVGDEVENADGAIVRSAALHDEEFPASLKAIARAGAGTNNIPIDRCSEVALLDRAENGYISSGVISGYLYNMYGVEGVDFAAVTKDFPQRENYVYVIPRGFSVYKHSNPVITENEDGSYTVVTAVQIFSHDSEAETAKASTLFVKNENSAFGFNIISSDIILEDMSL